MFNDGFGDDLPLVVDVGFFSFPASDIDLLSLHELVIVVQVLSRRLQTQTAMRMGNPRMQNRIDENRKLIRQAEGLIKDLSVH